MSKLAFMRLPHGATAASERAAIQNPRELYLHCLRSNCQTNPNDDQTDTFANT
jgi:hypothetical protein